MSNLFALGVVILGTAALLVTGWCVGYAIAYLLDRKDTP